MKSKNIIVAMGGTLLIAVTVVLTAAGEGNPLRGYCSGSKNMCMVSCKKCHAVAEAIGHVGNAYNMSGTCASCGASF